MNSSSPEFSRKPQPPIRAYQVMPQLASAAKLKHPEHIRCTKLRKHLATLSQLLNLKENEIEQLANHTGHDITVHREYYRLPVETILLTKMSKLLNLAQQGRTAECKGKSLQGVNIEVDESLPAGLEDSDNESTSEQENEREEEHNERLLVSYKDQDQNLPRQNHATERQSKVRGYNRWSTEQQDFILEQKEIQTLLKTKRVPGKSLCLLILKRGGEVLSSKTWTELRNKVHNLNIQAKSSINKAVNSRR